MRAVVGLLLSCTLAGCSEEPPPSLRGRWKAEDLQIQSLVLPAGPEFEVKESEVILPTRNISLPFRELEHKMGEATLRFPLGLGWTFFFDGPDRIYADVPLVGKIFYRRVVSSDAAAPFDASTSTSQGPALSARPQLQQPVTAPPVLAAGPSTAKASPVPASELLQEAAALIANRDFAEAEGALRDADLAGAPRAALYVERAALAAAQANEEDTLGHLGAALKAGLRPSALEGDARFTHIRADIRYRALVGRFSSAP